MTQEQFEKRQERAETETLIISRSDEGFRVYSPAFPTKSHTVSGSPKDPLCTCQDFQSHEGDSQWRCKHIMAVLNQLEKSKRNLIKLICAKERKERTFRKRVRSPRRKKAED